MYYTIFDISSQIGLMSITSTALLMVLVCVFLYIGCLLTEIDRNIKKESENEQHENKGSMEVQRHEHTNSDNNRKLMKELHKID